MLAHERLTAWRLCHELVLSVYAVTGSFPKHELYGLTSQARRAALSAATNIAEGAAKRGPAEFRRFLDIAVGSLAEVAYLLRVSHDLGLLARDDWKRLEALRGRAGYTTWRLYASMQKKAAGKP
jgi:four helix bundle protein